jgi:hypothetical protein
LPDMPAVTINPVTNEVSFALPENFPDEALALPAPDEVAEVVEETVSEVVEDTNAEVVEETDVKAA